VLGQQVRELQVWHSEVEPQTVKTIQEGSVVEFERRFPGFRVRQQPLAWGDLNTKLPAAIAAGSPPDLTHLNPFMTASLYTKRLFRPMDELIRVLGEKDIHEAMQKLQYFDGRYYGGTHAMGGIYIAERRDLREQKGLKPPQTYADLVNLAAALTEEGTRYGVTMPGEKLYVQRRQLGRLEDLAAPAREPGNGRDPPVPAAAEPVHAPLLVRPEVPRHPRRARDRKGGHGVPERRPDDWVHRALRARGHAGPGALPADVSGRTAPRGRRASPPSTARTGRSSPNRRTPRRRSSSSGSSTSASTT